MLSKDEVRGSGRETVVLEKDASVGEIEENQADFVEGGGFAEERFDGGGDYGRGLFARVAVGTGGDRGKGDGADLMFSGEGEGIAVAGSEEGGVGFAAAAHDGAHGVDYIFSGKVTGRGDDSLACGQSARELPAANFPALLEDAGAAAAVDGAINAATAEKSTVGGVDDGVDFL